MRTGRRLELVTLVLLVLVGSAVAVLLMRDAGPRTPVPADGPLWLRYLEAGMDAQDALWSRGAEASRQAYARADFAEAVTAARMAVTASEAFSQADPRRAAAEVLLARSLQAQERSHRTALTAH